MASLFDKLPVELYQQIVEYCDVSSLVALTRVTRRVTDVAEARLYRHVYYWDVGLPGIHPTSSADWRCAKCDHPCYDGVFTGQLEAADDKTRCFDLVRFANTLSRTPAMAGHVMTFQLQVQSKFWWKCEDDADDPENNPWPQKWRWFLGPEGSTDDVQGRDSDAAWLAAPTESPMYWAIESITRALDHLGWSRATFFSECRHHHFNPRLVQNMGEPLPFVLMLPHYATFDQRPYKYPRSLHEPTGTSKPSPQEEIVWHVETAVDYELTRCLHLDRDSLCITKSGIPTSDKGDLMLVSYTGRLVSLEEFIGAPTELAAFKQWLGAKSLSVLRGNSLESIVLRNLRCDLHASEILCEAAPWQSSGISIIGDFACLESLRPHKQRPLDRKPIAATRILLLRDTC